MKRLTNKNWKEIKNHCYAKGLYLSNQFTEEQTDEMIKRLCELEDKIESGELIPKDKIMDKIESIIDELVEIGFMDSQCQVQDCHKPDKIQCGDGVCIEENQKIWQTKILEALK